MLFDHGTRSGRLPARSQFLGGGEKVDGMGGHERAPQWQGQSKVSCLCESCVLVQFRHNHTVRPVIGIYPV